jgi:hypothetical protein
MKAFIFAVLFSVSLTVYAQNGFDVLTSEYTGNYTNHQFQSEVADVDLVRSTFQQNAGSDIVIERFFQISDEDEDAEDASVVNWVINNEVPVRPDDGDCFMVEILRGETERGVDGWDIFTRYSSINGWSYFLYYFSVYSK